MKNSCLLTYLILLLFITYGQKGYAQQGMPYNLNMVHNNPGEAPYVTKYNEAEFLKSAGFSGVVPHWHINCAITYDNYKKNVVKKNTDERKWIEKHAEVIDSKLDSLKKEGLEVYPFTDFLVFPKSIWNKYGSEILNKQSKHSNKPNLRNKRTQELLRAQIAGIFSRFPQIDGITLRFGETYLHDTPYHLGNSPIDGKNEIEDHILLINILREEICVKHNKKLFYRTWDFYYRFHNNPDFYLSVTNRVEPHENLIFSIKYQQGDFHRNCSFNPSIGQGKHAQIIESQSRMEAYGKGAHPYYTASGVINGWPETKYEIDWKEFRITDKLRNPSEPRGLKDVLSSGLLQGVVTWSHGGGWQGPYIYHEIWTDLNTYVVSNWSKNPKLTEEEIFYMFTREIGLDSRNADRFRQIALLSIEAVRKGQLNSYVQNKVWWARDDFFSASMNKSVLDEIFQKGVQDKILAEKQEAVSMWLQIEAISKQLESGDKDLQEAIRVSCTYGRIKYQLIEQMWILMLEEYRARTSNDLNNKLVSHAIHRYDELWTEWRNLKESSRFTATLHTELAFFNEKKGSIGEFVNRLRLKVK